MNNLFMSIETLTNGYKPEILDILSLISIIFGIFVIINKNPVISVLFLIGLFFTISCYLITLGISFIGLAYLLVYVGAVSILFLFIVMLINVRISELFTNTNNSIFLAIIIIITFNYAVINILPHNITRFNNLIVDNIMNNIFILFDSFAYFNLSKLKILFVTGNV
jgi:NADH-ubiquinone oxidoreductase chain 6